MHRTLAFSVFRRRLIILVHTKEPPAESEWQEYVEEARQRRNELRAFLVVTEGGGPNAMQRAALDEAVGLEKHPAKTAVVTVSVVARGIVTAIGWFSKNIKAFSTNQLPAALDFLEVPTVEHEGVAIELKRLRKGLNLPV
jgi:hypothetical protein